MLTTPSRVLKLLCHYVIDSDTCQPQCFLAKNRYPLQETLIWYNGYHITIENDQRKRICGLMTKNSQSPNKKAKMSLAKKMLWLFVMGSFLGYIIEMLFALFWLGHFEGRQGVIYGPFTQVYGIGAVVMALTVVPIAKKGLMPTMLVSFFMGGIVEYISSYMEEILFGTSSWDFSDQYFSIQGRTSLRFMLGWAILGCVFAFIIYPFFVDKISSVKFFNNNMVCIAVVVFFVLNFTISGMAVSRWVERTQNPVCSTTSVDAFLDKHYPDARMEKIYPKLRMVK